VLTVTGKISMYDVTCIKCNGKISGYKILKEFICECGAKYDVNLTGNPKVLMGPKGDPTVEYLYNFLGFVCIHSSYSDRCENICPASFMYCKEHSDESSMDDIKKSIVYAEGNLNKIKESFERMQESRKTWLIKKVSGIDEQDDSIRKDENGKD